MNLNIDRGGFLARAVIQELIDAESNLAGIAKLTGPDR